MSWLQERFWWHQRKLLAGKWQDSPTHSISRNGAEVWFGGFWRENSSCCLSECYSSWRKRRLPTVFWRIHLRHHYEMRFRTKDRDGNNCASRFKGEWWYNDCHRVSINGLYLHSQSCIHQIGMSWYDWNSNGKFDCMKTTETKIRTKMEVQLYHWKV